MNDEIREILEDYSCIPRIKNLEDYITNLQQENERLKNRNDFLNSVCVGFDDKYEDYKSKIEKAVEKLKREYYINEHEWNDRIINEVLNILQNGSDDNE